MEQVPVKLITRIPRQAFLDAIKFLDDGDFDVDVKDTLYECIDFCLMIHLFDLAEKIKETQPEESKIILDATKKYRHWKEQEFLNRILLDLVDTF